jgi:hypothetical protein
MAMDEFARAISGMSKLLKEFEPAGGDRGDLQPRVLATEVPAPAAMDAKLSGHQRRQAVSVASVPAAESEAAIKAGTRQPSWRSRRWKQAASPNCHF